MPMAYLLNQSARCSDIPNSLPPKSTPASSTKQSATRWTNSPPNSAAQVLASMVTMNNRLFNPYGLLLSGPYLPNIPSMCYLNIVLIYHCVVKSSIDFYMTKKSLDLLDWHTLVNRHRRKSSPKFVRMNLW